MRPEIATVWNIIDGCAFADHHASDVLACTLGHPRTIGGVSRRLGSRPLGASTSTFLVVLPAAQSHLPGSSDQTPYRTRQQSWGVGDQTPSFICKASLSLSSALGLFTVRLRPRAARRKGSTKCKMAQPARALATPVSSDSPPLCRCRAGGRPEAARRAGLEFVEKLFTATSTARTGGAGHEHAPPLHPRPVPPHRPGRRGL